jgi:malonate transporter and related proteins
MQVLFNVILPVFAIILCGYLSGLFGVISKDGAKSLNNYVFYVTLPALLFYSVAKAPIEQLTNVAFISANLIGILASFLLSMFIAKLVFKKSFPVLAIHGMNASYGTTGYMGIPLLIAAFGQKAALPAALATLIHNIPVITLVMLIFETSRVIQKDEKTNFIKILRDIAKPVLISPLTISVVLGAVIAFLGIQLPTSVDVFARFLADASGPTALFAIGLSFVNQKDIFNKSNIISPEVSLLVGLKLIFQPLLTILLVLYVFQLDPLWRTVTIIMSALPVGAGVYVFAQKYDQLVKQTSLAIVVSMIFSLITLSTLFIVFVR